MNLKAKTKNHDNRRSEMPPKSCSVIYSEILGVASEDSTIKKRDRNKGNKRYLIVH